MKTSEQAKKAIKEFEGLRLKAYRDCGRGVVTIGYGHTKRVNIAMTITQKQASMYFEEDLKDIEDPLTRMGLAKTQGQFDALVSWCFNLGLGKLTKGSDGHPTTLYKKIVAGAPTEEIQAQFKRWIYSGGKPLAGLVKRRAWEAEQWAK